MSNDVVAYAAAPPRLPARLQSQVATVLHAEWRPGELPRYDPEAAKALPAFDAACEPADAATIEQWLGALVAAVANPPAQADFRMRVGPVLLALGDLPAGVWTRETLRQAMRAFKWWPPVAELGDLLQPHADRITGTRDALAKIAKGERLAYAVEAKGYDPGPPPAWVGNRRVRDASGPMDREPSSSGRAGLHARRAVGDSPRRSRSCRAAADTGAGRVRRPQPPRFSISARIAPRRVRLCDAVLPLCHLIGCQKVHRK